LSKQLDFIGKEDKTETLFREGRDSLEYNREVVVIYKVIKDLATKKQIQEAYKGNARAYIAKLQRKAKNKRKLKFVLDKTRLIRFKRVVYLLEKVRKEFVKEIYKELLVRHLRINKTKEAVTACYYFLSIS
jgi:hypothetical protein